MVCQCALLGSRQPPQEGACNISTTYDSRQPQQMAESDETKAPVVRQRVLLRGCQPSQEGACSRKIRVVFGSMLCICSIQPLEALDAGARVVRQRALLWGFKFPQE